jgi:hypothetical protein
LQLKNIEKGVSIYIFEIDVSLNTVAPENKLVFRRDGDRHVLHQVVLAERITSTIFGMEQQ